MVYSLTLMHVVIACICLARARFLRYYPRAINLFPNDKVSLHVLLKEEILTIYKSMMYCVT